MSQGNVELVERSIDAFNRGDLEGVLETFAPEFELRPSGRFGDMAPVYRGRQGWVDFWSTFQAAWEQMAIRIERVEDLGDRVLSLGSFHGKGRGSGVAVEAEGAWLHTVRDDLIVEIRTFASWGEALKVAGVSE